MKAILVTATLVLSLSLLCGCGNTTPVSSKQYAAVPVDRVEILYQEPKRPYEVVALVSHSNVSWLPVSGDIRVLRELAAKAGADALIITTANGPTLTREASATGKAVKWTR